MSTRTLTYKRCDGCGRTDLHDEVEIVQSVDRHRWEGDVQTIDICEICEAGDKYLCHYCKRVHGDARPCAKVAAMMQEADTVVLIQYQEEKDDG